MEQETPATSSLACFLYNQGTPAKGHTTYRGLIPSISVISQENSPQTFPQVNLKEAISKLMLCFPRMLWFYLVWEKGISTVSSGVVSLEGVGLVLGLQPLEQTEDKAGKKSDHDIGWRKCLELGAEISQGCWTVNHEGQRAGSLGVWPPRELQHLFHQGLFSATRGFSPLIYHIQRDEKVMAQVHIALYQFAKFLMLGHCKLLLKSGKVRHLSTTQEKKQRSGTWADALYKLASISTININQWMICNSFRMIKSNK